MIFTPWLQLFDELIFFTAESLILRMRILRLRILRHGCAVLQVCRHRPRWNG